MTCEKCGEELRVGSWPFCGPNGHESVYRKDAQMMLSVVFRDPATGQYAIPGSAGDPCPAYMERVEVRDGRHWAQIESGMNAKAREEAQRVFAQDREGFGEVRREMRNDLRSQARSFGSVGREFADYALEQSRVKESRRKAREPEGKFSVRHYSEHQIRVQNEERMHEASKRGKR